MLKRDSELELYLDLNDMSEKIKLVYLDEELSWQSQVHAALNNYFELIIPETLPQNVVELWDTISECGTQAVLVDYRLNGSGVVAYTGDDVIREIHRHNKHLPAFIVTSFEDNAIVECREAQIIRGKELIAKADETYKLINIIKSGVNRYESQKDQAEGVLINLNDKLSKGNPLSDEDEANKFDAEMYLAELDLDSGVRKRMITTESDRTLKEILTLAREIVDSHKK